MNLIQISEYLSRQKQEFQKNILKITDLYQAYSNNFDQLEKDLVQSNIECGFGSKLV